MTAFRIAFVTAIFHNRAAANVAIDELGRVGFSQSGISVLTTDETHAREFGISSRTKAPEGAVTGAVAGGILGAILAGLFAVGSIVIPGGTIVTGHIVAALVGGGVLGVAGGLIGALIGHGIPEHEAKLVGDRPDATSILLGVQAEGDAKATKTAKQILRDTGGEGIKTEHAPLRAGARARKESSRSA